MFSGMSYKNGSRVNLLYWHINPYVYDSLCDREWHGPNEMFAKYVLHADWWEWAKKLELEIMMEMNHLPMDDMYVYTAFASMLPKDETWFRLKYEVSHLKDVIW